MSMSGEPHRRTTVVDLIRVCLPRMKDSYAGWWMAAAGQWVNGLDLATV